MRGRESFKLSKSQSGNSAYLELRAGLLPGQSGNVVRSVYIHDLIKDYNGPCILMGLNESGEPVGLEILYPFGDD